jgi:hypothetical protein
VLRQPSRSASTWLALAAFLSCAASSACSSSSGTGGRDAAPDHGPEDAKGPSEAQTDEGTTGGCEIMTFCGNTVFVPYGQSAPSGDLCGDECTCPEPVGGVAEKGTCLYTIGCPCPDAGS